MPNYLDLDPDELREIAKQHERAAANVRDWGKIPRSWLKEYELTRGAIADTMLRALKDYYGRRHEKAEKQAEKHEQTRDNLLAAARSMEETDQRSGGDVTRAGAFGSEPAGTGRAPEAVPDAPPMVVAGGIAPVNAGPVNAGQVSAGRVSAGPAASLEADSRRAPAPSGPPAATAWLGGVPASSSLPMNGSVPPRVAAPAATTPTRTAAAVPDLVPGRPVAGGSVLDDVSTGASASAPISASSEPASGVPSRSSPTRLPLGPLAAAVHVADDRTALPSLVVGEHAEDDLALACTLLAATLAAVADSAPALHWAVAVLRIRNRPIVVLTSNESRGWLPRGLFLPVEVVNPWKWDGAFGSAFQRATAVSEGVADPSRVFAELGPFVREKRHRFSALASSTTIAADIRESFGDDPAMAERVPAAESAVDFTAPGTGLVDRLALAGSDGLLQRAAAVPDSEIFPACLELVQEADARVRAAVPAHDAELSAHRAQRQRIIETLHASHSVPPSWVDEMRATDAMMAAAYRSQQGGISQIPIGVLPDRYGAEILRAKVFERRADELLSLLAENVPGRQTLRDMLYAYGQIVEHPLFPSAAPQTTAPSSTGVTMPLTTSARRPGAASSGTVSVSRDAAPPPIAVSDERSVVGVRQKAYDDSGIAGKAANG